MQGAAREEELYYCLGLDEVRRTNHKSLTQPFQTPNPNPNPKPNPDPNQVQRSGDGRQLHLQMCSVFEKRGFKEGFDWLSQHIK